MLHETSYLNDRIRFKISGSFPTRKAFYERGHTQECIHFVQLRTAYLCLPTRRPFLVAQKLHLCLNNPVTLILQGFCAITAAKVLCYHHCKSSVLSLLSSELLLALLHLHCKVRRYQRQASRKKQA